MQARPSSPTQPRRAARSRAATAALLVAAALVAGACLIPAAAQEATPAPAAVEIHLVGAPVAHGPDDGLNIRLRIINRGEDPLANTRLRIGVRDRVLSRSALEESFDIAPGLESSVFPVDVPQTVGPGEARDITVNEPVASFPTLAGATDGGVFPTTFSLQDGGGAVTFGSVAVPLVYHPEAPERPLDVHVLLPLDAGPSRGPSGSFREDEGGLPDLAEAAAEGGWLDDYLDALEEATRDAGPGRPLRISIAPTPRILEELADLADGAPVEDGDDLAPDSPTAAAARRALERLRLLLRRDVVEGILVPYASPDLPTLVDNLPLRHTVEQLSASDQVWEQVLEAEPLPDWFYGLAGRLDAPSLEQLQLLRRAPKTVFNEDSVTSLPAASGGCPEPFLSFSCAVRVRTASGVTHGFVADGIIQRALARLGGGRRHDRSVLQQVFAETAMVHAEIPGTEGRVVQVTLPEGWRPERGMARTLLMGLRRSSWIRSRTADGALAVASETVERDMVERAAAPADGPDESFYNEIERARVLLNSYASVVPAGTPRLQRLQRNLLVAAGGSWLRRQNEAAPYLTGSIDEVLNELDKIGITGASDVTLTSQRAPVQIVISNETTTPARLALHFISSDLRFDEERIVDTYPPGSHPLTLEPAATGSGVFQVAVRLETTDGYLVDERRIVVRSTSFNQVALGITVGALAFLVLFYVFKAVRKRADEREGTPTD